MRWRRFARGPVRSKRARVCHRAADGDVDRRDIGSTTQGRSHRTAGAARRQQSTRTPHALRHAGRVGGGNRRRATECRASTRRRAKPIEGTAARTAASATTRSTQQSGRRANAGRPRTAAGAARMIRDAASRPPAKSTLSNSSSMGFGSGFKNDQVGVRTLSSLAKFVGRSAEHDTDAVAAIPNACCGVRKTKRCSLDEKNSQQSR